MDHDDYDDTVKVKHDGPMNVRGRQPVSITTETFTLQPGVPQRILGENKNRCVAYVSSDGTKPAVLIGSVEVTSAGAGYPLPASQTTAGLELRTVADVWAVVPAGGAATQVSVLAEHYDGAS